MLGLGQRIGWVGAGAVVGTDKDLGLGWMWGSEGMKLVATGTTTLKLQQRTTTTTTTTTTANMVVMVRVTPPGGGPQGNRFD